jgi:hypothetical protein
VLLLLLACQLWELWELRHHDQRQQQQHQRCAGLQQWLVLDTAHLLRRLVRRSLSSPLPRQKGGRSCVTHMSLPWDNSLLQQQQLKAHVLLLVALLLPGVP